MSEKTPYTRRQFLERGVLLASAGATLPTFLVNTGSALAGQQRADVSSLAGVPEDRVLVVVQLSGGNDGLNTVIPYGMPVYHRERGRLRVTEGVLPLNEDVGIGLHPALRPLHELVGEKKAAIVQGVGYPNPTRSHFASMDVWHAGDTDAQGSRGVDRGWIGKALDHDLTQRQAQAKRAGKPFEDPYAGLASVAVGSVAPSALRSEQARPVTFERPELFRWLAEGRHPAIDRAYDTIHHREAVTQPAASPPHDNAADFVYRTALDARAASDRVRKALEKDPKTSFPRGKLADQLRTVAAMIRAELPTRVYYVALGGFDTHAGQPWRHQNLLGELAKSLAGFQKELDATGHADRVVTLTFSEFGRRVRENASQGTDHGAAGPVFLTGA
ncbi:MAG: DUF1501 domain-containing protein, partial [Phycisphaeraceae bacterium]